MVQPFGKILPTATAYAFFVAIVNLFIYWNTFDIDIFSHITAYEILSRSIPLTSIGLLTLFGFAIGEIITRQIHLSAVERHEHIDKAINSSDIDLAKNLIESERDKITKHENFYNKAIKPLTALSYLMFFAILSTGFYYQTKQWMNAHLLFYSIAIGVLIQNLINHTNFIYYSQKYAKLSAPTVHASIAFFFVTIGATASDAYNIKDGNSYTKVTAIESSSNIIKEKSPKIALLGETDNQVFFWDIEHQKTLRVYLPSITGIETSEYKKSKNNDK